MLKDAEIPPTAVVGYFQIGSTEKLSSLRLFGWIGDGHSHRWRFWCVWIFTSRKSTIPGQRDSLLSTVWLIDRYFDCSKRAVGFFICGVIRKHVLGPKVADDFVCDLW